MPSPSLTVAAASTTNASASAAPGSPAGEMPPGAAFAALLDALAQPQALPPALAGAAAGLAETAAAPQEAEANTPWLAGLPEAAPQVLALLPEPVSDAAAPVPALPSAPGEGFVAPAAALVDPAAAPQPPQALPAPSAQPPAWAGACVPGTVHPAAEAVSTLRLAAPPAAAMAAQAEPALAREAPGGADGRALPAANAIAHERPAFGEAAAPASATPAADLSPAGAADPSPAPAAHPGPAPAADHAPVPGGRPPEPSALAGPLLHSAQAGPVVHPAASAPQEVVHQAALPSRPLDVAFGGDLAAEVRLMVASGMQRAELRLNPADLGPIHIQLSVNSHTADISFAASHGTTREGISGALPALREMLASQGLSLGQADVSSQHPGQPPADARTFSMRAPAVHAGTGAAALAEPTPGALRPGRGMLDLYA